MCGSETRAGKVDLIEFKGPFGFFGENSIFAKLNEVVNGVYLWCVHLDDHRYRVYYVGETGDVKNRISNHLKSFMSGEYAGHCLKSLKENVRILMHRAHEGMVPRFSHIDAKTFNEDLAKAMHLFYASVPKTGNGDADDKWLRCRIETGIVTHIENAGPNIIHVGKLQYWKNAKCNARVSTDNVEIEYLTNETILY